MPPFRKTATALGLSAALIIVTASIAGSHGSKSSNKDVAARHDMMELVGRSIGVLASTAKGEIAFNAGLVNAAATSLKNLGEIDPGPLWTEGTEQGAAQHSRAKPEIWTDAADFKMKLEDMATAAEALIGAQDIDAVRAGMGALGGTCKACHEKYRGPEN